MGKGINFDTAEHARRMAEELRKEAARVAENRARDERRIRDEERMQRERRR
jgi:hypothetical protein